MTTIPGHMQHSIYHKKV